MKVSSGGALAIDPYHASELDTSKSGKSGGKHGNTNSKGKSAFLRTHIPPFAPNEIRKDAEAHLALIVTFVLRATANIASQSVGNPSEVSEGSSPRRDPQK